MENLDKKDFRFIIIESPSNVIEDINCIFENYIIFRQIKKKDDGHWKLNGIKDTIDHLFEIFSKDREKIYKKLNLDPVKKLDFKFSFITNQAFNSDIRDFVIFLKKNKNKERDAEFQKLNYLINKKNRVRFFDFLKSLELTPYFYPSRNLDSTTEGIEEESLKKIEKKFNVDKNISSKILGEILRIITKKSEGKTIKSRTLYKIDLNKVVMFYKTNENKNIREELSNDFEIVITCLEQFIEKIDQVMINIEYKKKDNIFKIPLKIDIFDKSYYFYLIDRKITRELQSDLNHLNELIKEENNTFILIFRGKFLNLDGLDMKNFFNSNEKLKFKQYFEELIFDKI